MLSEILATIIAFISVILLLSIVVTSMVQVSQALLRLRSRNLMKGIAALIASERAGKGPDAKPTTRKERAKAKKDAVQVMNASNVALMDRVNRPDSWYRYWLFGPKVSWIDPKALEPAIKEARIELSPEARKRVVDDFKKSNDHLRKRFLMMARGWSVFWALIIAVAFQVSAPTLFSELTRDTARREHIVADADQILTYGAEALAHSGTDMAAPDALAALADANPQHREHIEQASGVGTTRAFIVDELSLALEDLESAERHRLVADYEALLDEAVESRLEDARETVTGAVDRLAKYNFELWPRGWDYYLVEPWRPRWDAIVGVLITAILLSFGGSFWFEQLRGVLALRDTLTSTQAPPKKTDSGKEHILNVQVAQPGENPEGLGKAGGKAKSADDGNDEGTPDKPSG